MHDVAYAKTDRSTSRHGRIHGQQLWQLPQICALPQKSKKHHFSSYQSANKADSAFHPSGVGK